MYYKLPTFTVSSPKVLPTATTIGSFRHTSENVKRLSMNNSKNEKLMYLKLPPP